MSLYRLYKFEVISSNIVKFWVTFGNQRIYANVTKYTDFIVSIRNLLKVFLIFLNFLLKSF